VLFALSAVLAHPGEAHGHAEVVKQINARDFWANRAKKSINQWENTDKYQAAR